MLPPAPNSTVKWDIYTHLIIDDPHSCVYIHSRCLWATEHPIVMWAWPLKKGPKSSLSDTQSVILPNCGQNMKHRDIWKQAGWGSIPSGPLPSPYSLGALCPKFGKKVLPEKSGTQTLIETSQALGSKQLPGNDSGRWRLVCGSWSNGVGPRGRCWGRTMVMDCRKGKDRLPITN